VLSLGLVLVASCGKKDECQGAERCACYANDTCNAGLECRSNLCVGSTANGSGGTSSIDSAACVACAEDECSTEYAACKAATGCLGLVDCALGCGSDVTCLTGCSKDVTPETAQKLATYETCALTRCTSDCVAVPAGVGGTSGSMSGGGLGACVACGEKACPSENTACGAGGCKALVTCVLDCNTDVDCAAECAQGKTEAELDALTKFQDCTVKACQKECTPSGGSGGASGLGGTGGSSGGMMGSGGSTPITPTPGVNWLTLVSNAAPSSAGVNGALGVEGVFYAYGDPCATSTMQWDPTSRCLSGELCVADSTGTNWGVAIGFDLDNRSEVKHAWNATTAGVTGFAWTLSVSAPTEVQFWVQNMDPAYGATCSAMSCSIAGPPDGRRVAGPSGQVYFSSMEKDDWGGTGTDYLFDPSRISSLQFKLPAPLDSLLTSYQLCVNRVGVIR
jgi:hypothetical protein